MFKRKRKAPVIRKRSEHPISRKMIDRDAVTVLYRLSRAGFTAYLVGGAVRDLLLGIQPKDFDIATDAYPNQIRRLFRNAFLIGRRFRLALIRFGPKQIEASTFRRQPEEDEVPDGHPGTLYQSEDNYYGTPEEDALRRDFTVNGLFYDIKTFAVIDHVGGLRDLEKRVLRSIGDPNIRFREDPVRMMRAVRLAATLDFRIHRESQRAIARYYGEIVQASKPRLYEEILKFFGRGAAAEGFRQLWSTKLMSVLLPALDEYIEASGRKRSPLWKYLSALDEQQENPLSGQTSLCVATLLMPIYLERVAAAAEAGGHVDTLELARDVVRESYVEALGSDTWRLPRAVAHEVAAILSVQPAFSGQGRNLRRQRFFPRDWFPMALLLYRIRAVAEGDSLEDVVAWETEYERHQQSAEKRRRAREAVKEGDGSPAKGRKADGSEQRQSGRRRRTPRKRNANRTNRTAQQPGAARTAKTQGVS